MGTFTEDRYAIFVATDHFATDDRQKTSHFEIAYWRPGLRPGTAEDGEREAKRNQRVFARVGNRWCIETRKGKNGSAS